MQWSLILVHFVFVVSIDVKSNAYEQKENLNLQSLATEYTRNVV